MFEHILVIVNSRAVQIHAIYVHCSNICRIHAIYVYCSYMFEHILSLLIVGLFIVQIYVEYTQYNHINYLCLTNRDI